ncbi:hypothetical protein PSY28_23235, partial [Shigella flexneri]|nr:hypothetical protein [Shigella flexneri]
MAQWVKDHAISYLTDRLLLPGESKELIFFSHDFILHPKESDDSQKKCHLNGKNKRRQERD